MTLEGVIAGETSFYAVYQHERQTQHSHVRKGLVEQLCECDSRLEEHILRAHCLIRQCAWACRAHRILSDGLCDRVRAIRARIYVKGAAPTRFLVCAWQEQHGLLFAAFAWA